MAPKIGTEFNIVGEWNIGPKSDKPGVILVLHHLPLRDAMSGKEMDQTAYLLTPDQAAILGRDLQKNAELFPEGPNGPTN